LGLLEKDLRMSYKKGYPTSALLGNHIKRGKMSTEISIQSFFDFAAEVGLTKHIGGIAATEALIELCHIDRDSYILDVGCGVGATACFIATKVGCRVVGVDILEKMVERSRERATREKLTHRVEFRVADAQNLPFEDNLFDAVLTESVTAFPENKQKAVSEYARVTKPGGYVGMNETTWLKIPPPPEVVAWAAREVGASVKPLTPDEWVGLLDTAGLKEITNKIHTVDIQNEAKSILRRYGWGGILRVTGRALLLYAKSPLYRDFVKRVRQGGIIPDHLNEYFGYGLFIGRKE
jgi:arsenite methyltransferase